MSLSGVTSLRDELARHDQAHLLDHWDGLTAERRAGLEAQIRAIDFAQLAELARGEGPVAKPFTAEVGTERLPATRLVDPHPRIDPREARDRGEAELRAGRVAVLMVAGGQGTRLGFPHPKGMLPTGPISGRTLFRIFADGILGLRRKYGAELPVLVMTSPATHAETVAEWRARDWHGLDPRGVHFFEQGTMPAVDATTGRVLLEAPDRIAVSPDGHGGVLAAMTKAGLWSLLEGHGIAQVFYFQVDNPLVAIADPTFLGYHLAADSDMTTQVVAKRDPLERVGNLVYSGGHLRIIEYSDLSEARARAKSPDGSLVLWAGSIAVHAMRVDFLRRMADSAEALPFHLARKVVPFVDRHGTPIVPERPNAIKFERFIFDILPLAKNPWVVEVDPAEGFAPIKNGLGAATDTLATAQQAILDRGRRWCAAAGFRVTPTARIEIAATAALDPQDLRGKYPAGKVIERDLFLS